MTLGSFEDQLLRNGIDLVVTDVASLSDHIHQVAPNTPQMAPEAPASKPRGFATITRQLPPSPAMR